MAVDIKTLHIGSLVEYDRKRMVVASVSNKLMNCENLILIEPSTLTLYKNVNSYDVEPISIAPELLKGLGFEERRREYLYGAPDVWYIDREAAQLEKENNLVIPTIHVSSLGKTGYADWWVIKVVIGDKPMRSDNCTVRYLHEAEAFLALHGVELIKE